MHATVLKERKFAARSAVEIALATMSHFASLENRGSISHEDAVSRSLALVRSMRYGGSAYFFVVDMRGWMLMHPIKKELEGTFLSDLQDVKGTYFWREFFEKASTSGYVEYYWPKPETNEPVKKLTYVKAFEPWNMMVMSGIYLDDVEERYGEYAQVLGIVGAIGFAAILTASFFLNRHIVRPLRTVTDAFDRLIAGERNLTIETSDRRDEMGILIHAVAEISDSLKIGSTSQSSWDWLWETDEQHRFKDFYGDQELSGLFKKTTVGKTRVEIMGPWNARALIEQHQADLDARRPIRDFMYRTGALDGNLRHLSINGTPKFDFSGTFLGYHGTARDITERIEAEEKVRGAESRLLDAIAVISEAVILFDDRDQMVVCNDKFRTLMPGLDGVAYPGASFSQVIAKFSDAVAYDASSNAPLGGRWMTQHGNADGLQVILQLPDGNWLQAASFRTNDGGLLATYTDVTILRE
ncbi:MAG TPA: PAS domain S-box protein, partial [Rhodospirillaceae bacterium]|nr:PAS domain S-box protein [Rhodospirillaceae bacterium]